MKFSIIIPTYNVENYIIETLNSCWNQNILSTQYEIIVVDDGSTDNTLKVVEEFASKHKNIKVYTQENDGAPGKARNKGIDVSSGEYLYFLDSDDLLPKNILEDLYQKVVNNNADILIGKNIRFDDKGNKWGEYSLDEGFVDFENSSYFERDKISNVAHTRIFKREFIVNNDIRFIRKYPSQDTYFSTIANYKAKTIYLYDKVIYLYRDRLDEDSKSLMQKRDYNTFYGRLMSMGTLVDHFNKVDNKYAEHLFNYRLRGIINLMQKSKVNSKDINKLLNVYIDKTKLKKDLFIPYNRAVYEASEKKDMKNSALFWVMVRAYSIMYYIKR